jgi:hypothetical protein
VAVTYSGSVTSAEVSDGLGQRNPGTRRLDFAGPWLWWGVAVVGCGVVAAEARQSVTVTPRQNATRPSIREAALFGSG